MCTKISDQKIFLCEGENMLKYIVGFWEPPWYCPQF